MSGELKGQGQRVAAICLRPGVALQYIFSALRIPVADALQLLPCLERQKVDRNETIFHDPKHR